MPPVLLDRSAAASWSVARHVALTPSVLAFTAVVSAACVYPPRPTGRPIGPPPVRQSGIERPEARSREPDDIAYLRSRRLIIPVVGVRPDELHDDFYDVRGGGSRQHNAIDILAPYGTPILAADDGYVIRMSRNSRGGITIHATDPEERVVYYYAHLAGYFDGLTPGKALVKGDTIGYVGTSGNAPEDTPHLHFQITRMRPGRRYWDGQPLNPYPLLRHPPEPKREDVAGHVVTPQATPRPRDPPRPVEPPDPVDPPIPPAR